MKIANPQGKASLPLLQELQQSRPRQVTARSPATLLKEFCLAALVLGADFRFKPVPGKHYYLYLVGSRWQLSLVAPGEWRCGTARRFVAECRLRTDMTWDVSLDATATGRSQIAEALSQHVNAFTASLSEAGSVPGALPYYHAALPYYQRVLASGLAVSLNQSIRLLDARERACLESGVHEGLLRLEH